MNVNYDRVCRLCLSSRGEILPIFPTTSSDDSEPPVLASKIKECVSVQINENDDLPTNVCRKCMDNVNNWHIFKTVCERTQNKLHSLIKKDGSQLEEVKVKSEPLSDEAYHDGVVIDGSYPDPEQPGPSKLQPEGPPILASLGLTPRSDKGVESEKDEEEEEEDLSAAPSYAKVPATAMPEVSITVMRPSGETLHARQGIQQLASKDCLVCGRSYRYSHNARRHELTSHEFDRYTNKIANKKIPSHMQPKLRPNPFNPKARLMPNPISHKMHLIPKPVPHRVMHQKPSPPPKPIGIPIKHTKTPQNNLPYPLRIKALKDLQIKKKEPQILKTLLTSKPEVLISEPEIMNSAPESPETLISEPEIASFQVEAILSEPDGYDQQNDEVDGEIQNNQSHPYDTVDMGSDNEIEIARENEKAADETQNEHDEQEEENMDLDGKDVEDNHDDGKEDPAEDYPDGENNEENVENKIEDETKEDDQEGEDQENHEQDHEANNEENEEYEDEVPPAELAPMVELNEDMQTNSYISEQNEEEEDLDITADPNENIDADDSVKELDPNKLYVTKTQRDFISKYRDIIEQINTKRCLCCDKEHPRRKAVIQHLQKNGHKVPKHTCYNCVVTFSHIGALLSHMRQNACTNLWKIIYNENGITDDLVLEKGPRSLKAQFKDILNARSYGCKLCPAKFQLKQFITKHILDCHEDGQSGVPTVCVHCGNRFKDKNILKRHVRSAECLIYVHCEICPEKFGNLQEFTEHALASHTDNVDQDNSNKCVDGRPTDCPLCGNKSSNYPGLVKHLRIYHDEDKPHYCQHCDSKFEQANDLNNHIYKAHSDLSGAPIIEPDMSLVKEEAEEYHYSCTECNAIFETVDAWTDHQVAEHNQIAHHCDQCEKKFLRPSELAEHKNTHLRVKFYPCSVCSNSYSTPQKLSDHVQQMHPGAAAAAFAAADTEFFCTICIRPFKSRQAYSNHMRIHSKVPTTNRRPQDPKSFAPQIIGKSIKMTKIQQGFIFKPNCNVPNAPYSCDICGKGFMHKKNIWKHKKVLHADLVGDRNDSEENTMQASTEEDEYNVDENGIALSTPQFNSFNFANFANNAQQTQTEAYTCDICYQRFSLREGLRKHKRAKHGVVNPSTSNSSETQTQATPSEGSSSRSNCTICKISFTDKRSYYRHRKNVHKSTAQMCKICGKPLSSTLELYEHLKAAHARELLGYNANQGTSKTQDILVPEVELGYDGDQDSVEPSVDYQAKYPCDTCGKQFVGLLALQNHQCITQITPQPSTFDCEICHKSYTSIAALKSHRGWHLRSPDGKAAANNSGLWMPQHKVTNKVSKHEVVDPSQLARVTHSTPAAAAAAPKRRLPPEVEVTVVNPNKKMRSDDSVDMESQNMSGTADDRYCTICDKEFTKRAAYQRHMDEVHQPNSVFCPVCDKSFTRKSTLLVHMKKHYEGGEGGSAPAEEEGAGCDVCGVQFDSVAALRAHRARHHGEDESSRESEDDAASAACGEFTCAQCGDGVATPRDLLAHRTMHATPTKYFCNICKVYFARALDLSSHTRARHSDTDKSAMFPCAMCDRFYMNKKSLQRHIEMAH